jgi:glutathione S-transferase
MPKVTLVGLTYSPWTHRAQWALDHHGIGYAFEHYLPVVGEPMLRVRARKFSGKMSVPVLLTPHGAIDDSIRIARHADSIGSGSKLWVEAVDNWLPVAEDALDAARALVLRAVEESPLAQEESVSLPMPRALKGPTAKFGTMMLRRKYAARYPEHDAEERVAGALDKLRRALDGQPYLTGSFSLADIVMTGVVQAIKPVDDRFIKLQPGTRAAWTRPRLAEKYSDLVQWRDRLFEKHRNAPS